MSDLNCSELADIFISHIRSNYLQSRIGDDCLVVTPFLNADLAPIEIYIQSEGNLYRITDEGEALNQLFVSGLEIEGNKELMDAVNLTAALHGVHFRDSELFTIADKGDLGEALQNLVSAVQAVSFLIYKQKHRQKINFEDEVERLLINNRIKYDPKFTIKGNANRHTIPFYINSNKNILLEPLSATTVPSARSKAKKVAYTWLDLQKVYADKYKYTVIIDDKNVQHQNVWNDDEARSALQNYSTRVLAWNEDQQELIQMVKG